MQVRPPLVPDLEAAVLVDLGDRPLDHPPMHPQPAPVRFAPGRANRGRMPSQRTMPSCRRERYARSPYRHCRVVRPGVPYPGNGQAATVGNSPVHVVGVGRRHGGRQGHPVAGPPSGGVSCRPSPDPSGSARSCAPQKRPARWTSRWPHLDQSSLPAACQPGEQLGRGPWTRCRRPASPVAAASTTCRTRTPARPAGLPTAARCLRTNRMPVRAWRSP